jgi:hypothetical protein
MTPSGGFDISREISDGFFMICFDIDLIFGGIVALNINVWRILGTYEVMCMMSS